MLLSAGRWRRLLSTRLTFLALVVVLALSIGAAIAVAARRTATPEDRARDAADEFLDRYVDDDGRVIRLDQGGDTVSEGQAYALLISAGIGDEDRFRLVWAWTERHLQRDDALLAWRWDDGRVTDPSPAADADLLAAAALSLGGRRFGDPSLTDEASALSAAIIDHETIGTDVGPVLVAGPWARTERVVNPSYLVVGAMSRLWHDGRYDWAPVAATSRRLLREVTQAAPHLPPDWANVGLSVDEWDPQPSPSGDTPRYSYDAQRVLVQLAVDCAATGQQIASRSWTFLDAELGSGGSIEAAYHLDGRPLVLYSHPTALVAAAASAAAAGEDGASADLLDEAASLDETYPSYYGAAWVALGRLWLDTPLLGGCRPTHPTR